MATTGEGTQPPETEPTVGEGEPTLAMPVQPKPEPGQDKPASAKPVLDSPASDNARNAMAPDNKPSQDKPASEKPVPDNEPSQGKPFSAGTGPGKAGSGKAVKGKAGEGPPAKGKAGEGKQGPPSTKGKGSPGKGAPVSTTGTPAPVKGTGARAAARAAAEAAERKPGKSGSKAPAKKGNGGSSTRSAASQGTAKSQGSAKGSATATKVDAGKPPRVDTDDPQRGKIFVPGQHRRLAVVYDIEPPHVRLGFLWFVIAVVCWQVGVMPFALAYAVTSGFAGIQVARSWRRRPPNRPDVLVSGLGAAVMPLAAAFSTPAIGVVVLLIVAGAFIRAQMSDAPSVAAAASRTLQSALFAGGAAAGIVAVYRFEHWAALALLLCVSAYETGDYIVGSGARHVLEGPIAGIVSVLVVQLAVSAYGMPPFNIGNGLWFALMAAVLAPLGQLATSLIMPSAAAHAPAMRRLDSLVLLGPLWALAAGYVAANAV